MALAITMCVNAQHHCATPTNVNVLPTSYNSMHVSWHGPGVNSQTISNYLHGNRLNLFNQSQLTNYPGVGYNDADVSSTYGDQATLGLYANIFDSALVADDFILENYSYISSIQFYAYQNNSGIDTSSIKGVYVAIYDQNPINGSAPIWGDYVTDRMISSSWTGIYLTTQNTFTNTDCPIMKVVAEIDTFLASGNYWVTVAFSGNPSLSGPWAPPVRNLLQVNTGNALQYDNQSWVPWRDSQTLGQYGLPFIVKGYAQTDSLLGFNVFRNGVQLNSSLLEDYSFLDEDAILRANTEYCYTVNAVYLNGCTSSETTPVCASTLEDPCVITSLPYTNNFDSYGTGIGTFPSCWTKYYSDTISTYPYIINTVNFSSPGSLYMYAVSGYYSMAITPKFDASIPINSLRATFKIYKIIAIHNLIVGVIDTLTNPPVFTPIDTLSPSAVNSWEEFEVDFSNYSGSGHHIAFKSYAASAYNTIYIENLEIYTIPLCERPGNIRAENATSNSVDILWHPVGNTTRWTLEYKASNVSTWTTVQNLTDTIYTIPNLASSTSYQMEIRVKSLCLLGEPESLWKSATVSFNTLCPSISIFPYEENFDTYGTGSTVTPACWEQPSSNDTYYENVYPNLSTANFISAPAGLYFKSSANYQTMISLPSVDPSVSLSALQVRFKVKMGSVTSNFKVGIMTNPIDTSTFTVVQSITPGNTTTWLEYEVPLTSYDGNGRFISIKSLRGNGDNTFTIDNLVVEYISSCVVPHGIAINNITTTSAIATWNTGGPESSWEVRYKTSTDSLWISYSVNDSSCVMQSLIPGSNYEFQVRAFCGNEYSRWSSGMPFFTPCEAIVSLPYTENFDTYGTGIGTFPTCWSRYYSGTTTTVPNIGTTCFSSPGSLFLNSSTTYYTMAMTPQIANSYPVNSLQATFKVRKTGAAHNLFIGVIDLLTDPNTFTPIDTISPVLTNNWEIFDVSFGSYTGNGHYIAFKCGNGSVSNTIYVDDFELYPIPTCLRPANVAASNITTTGADISWTASGSESEWIVEYKNIFDESWTIVSNIFSPTTTLSGLIPNASYIVRVKALCNLSGESDYSFDYIFHTGCAVISSLPYNENFDTYGTGTSVSLPCWTKPSTNFSYYPYVYATNPYSAPGCLYFNASSTRSTYGALPAIDTSIAMNSLKAKFKVRMNNVAHNFKIGVMSDPSDPATFTIVQAITPGITATWTEYEISFATYTGTGRYIAFASATGASNIFFIDDLTIDYIPTCFRPIDVTLSSIVQTSANISWTPVSGEQEWEVAYKAQSDNQWTTISNIHDTTYLITGLLAGTSYKVRVKAVCGPNSISDWTLEKTFITHCNPMVTLPYIENFDTYGTGTSIFPTCWIKNSTYNNFPHVNATSPNSLPGSLYFYSSSTTYNIAALPEFDSSIPMHNLQISFKLRKQSADYSIQVGVMTSPEDESTFEAIQTLSPASVGGWEDFTVYLLPYTGQGRFIAFKSDNSSTNGMFLDNLVVDNFVGCVYPLALHTSALTHSSATIQWVSSNNQLGFELVYGRSGFNMDTATIHSANVSSYVINGLAPETSYDVYVRTLCSATDTTRWSDVYTFTTSCPPVTTIPYREFFDGYGTGTGTFPDCWVKNSNAATSAFNINPSDIFSAPGALYFSNTPANYSIAATPEFYDDLNTLQISFKAKMTNLNYKLEVGVMSNPYDSSTFELIQLVEPTTIYWNEYVIPLTSYIGNAKYIAFRTATGSNNIVYLDNVEVDYAPPCVQPINLNVTDITLHSAQLSWSPGGEELGWIVSYGERGFSPNTSGTVLNADTIPLSITGLTPGTHYDFYVKAVCGPNYESDWSLVSSFTTLCEDIISLPYTENFDSYGTGDLSFPTCWTRQSNYTSEVYPNLSTTNFSSPASLYFYSSSSTYSYATTPKFSNTIDISDLRVSFKMRKNTNLNNIQVGVMTDPMDESTFSPVDIVAPHSLNYWENMEVLFSSYTGTGKYIAFRSDNGAANFVYIDDVIVSYIPACVAPVNLEVTSLSSTSATISWHERMYATSWNIEYGPSGFTPGNGLLAIAVDTTHAFNGLTPDTEYDVYVQSDCGDSVSANVMLSFKTYCSADSQFPITENFDSYGTGVDLFPDCWHRVTTSATTSPYISTNLYYTSPASLYLYSDIQGYTFASTNEIVNTVPVNTLKATFKLRKGTNEHSLQIGVFDDPTDKTTFVPIDTLSPIYINYWDEFTVPFDSYTGTGHYIGFMSSTGAANSVYLDDLVIDFIVTCLPPTNIMFNAVTSNSASVIWYPAGDESQWVFEFKEATSNTWTPIVCTTPTANLISLSSNTSYEARIKALCSPSNESDYSTIYSFSTSPATYTIVATAGDHGTINPSGNVTVNEGSDRLFQIAANNGFVIEDVLVDNVSQGAISSYNFVNVTDNHTISVSFAVGIEENEANSILIYPNPAGKVLNVTLTERFKSLEISNILGQILIEKTVTDLNMAINISALNSGVYFIRLKGENCSVTKKFIKE